MRIFFITLLISLIANSCKTYSYFLSPNNLLNENCQIYLMDGSVAEGKMTAQFETGYTEKTFITILTKDNIQKKIHIPDIKYYKYDNNTYYPKELNMEAYVIPGKEKIYLPNVKNLLFVKEVTKPDSKIHFFELFQSRKNSFDGMDHYDYYFSLDSENRFLAWSIGGNRLFPHFEDKMSYIVSSCPSLAEKIKEKKEGYFVRQSSLDLKKEEVIKRIIDEYNNCQ